MRDTELYRHLLGLVTPWEVERVDLSVEDGRVDVWVKHPKRTRFACPDCERELSVYDHSEERAWRHLDSCAFLTFLHASPPRVSCPEHGVRQVRVPFGVVAMIYEARRECCGRTAAAVLGRGVAPDGPRRGPGPGRQAVDGPDPRRGR